MTGTVTRTGSIAALALLAALALYLAAPSTAASAAPATDGGNGYRASEWSKASDSAGEAPSLTDGALAPEGPTGSQLWLGFGLFGPAVLGLLCALTLKVAKPLASGALAGTRGDPRKSSTVRSQRS
jgi:hypothetical protein